MTKENYRDIEKMNELQKQIDLKPNGKNKLKQEKINKIKINLDKKQMQKLILRKWEGASRFYYNKTVSYVNNQRKNNIKISYTLPSMRKEIMKNEPSWSEEIPYEIKDQGIDNACKAYKNSILKYKTSGIASEVKFRKKGKNTSFGIPKNSITKLGIYTTYLNDMYYSENDFIEKSALSRIQITKSGEYYLCIPELKHKQTPEKQQDNIISLDPGIRTFQTYYSPLESGEIGKNAITRIDRLLHQTDKLQSEISNLKGNKKKSKTKARFKIFDKVKNLVSELHHKSAHWLTSNYKHIIIPEFATQDMVKKWNRKLNKNSARRLNILSHYKFRQILEHHASKNQASVNVVSEAWTSKTCGCCGFINSQLGSKKLFTCPHCGLVIDRDVNGARNIFIRTLRDFSDEIVVGCNL